MVKVDITLTWSKLMALIVLALAFTIDIMTKGNSTMAIALPSVAVMLGVKQGADAYKTMKNGN